MRLIKRKNKLGFTLIELLITISIASVLSAVILSNIGNHQKKARDAKRKADLNDIRTALQMYYEDKGQYPPSGSTVYNTNSTIPQTPWIQDLSTDYIKELPRDPKNTALFFYRYDTPLNHSSFTISANLENDNDPQRNPGCNTNESSHDYCLTNL